MSKVVKKMKRLSIRVPEWIYKILVKEAKRRGVSMNGLIGQMCFELSDLVKENLSES